MVALQNLNGTASQLQSIQNVISTGKKIGSARDNGALWATAKVQSSTASALDSVKSSLQRGMSIVDVGLSAGDNVTDLLGQMKEKALAAADSSASSNSLKALAADFNSLRDQITKAVTNSKFNGKSLVDGKTAKLTFLQNEQADAFTVTAATLTLSAVGLSKGSTFTTATNAKSMITTLENALNTVTNKLAKLGTTSKALQSHYTFVGKIQDSLNAGVGNLVDADMAKESANLTALQTKQQLGVQALSIANQAPQSLLGLFR